MLEVCHESPTLCLNNAGGGECKWNDPAEIDAMLAKEMNQLSMEERDEILFDIHGVAEMINETEDFVVERLDQLEVALANIPTKPEYDRAMYMDPDYVQNRKFRLMFLRADSFHAEKAAARMVMFFHEKQKLFGTELLCRDIQWKDLDTEDQESIEAGFMQIFPVPDRAGRTILCLLPMYKKHDAPLDTMVGAILVEVAVFHCAIVGTE